MHLILNNVSESNDLFFTMLRVRSHSAQDLIQAFCHLQVCLMQQHPLWHIRQNLSKNPQPLSHPCLSVCLSVCVLFFCCCFFNTLPSKLPVGFFIAPKDTDQSLISPERTVRHSFFPSLRPISSHSLLSLLCFRADVLSHTEEQKSSSLSLSSFNKCHLFWRSREHFVLSKSDLSTFH